MSINKKKNLYNFGEYSFITLKNANKEDLLDIISALNNNIQAHKERENVIRERLTKCYEYFEKQGLTNDEIVKIVQLDCEKY